jgi:hypothetical protein
VGEFEVAAGDRLVWALVEGKLRTLREEVEFLLTES